MEFLAERGEDGIEPLRSAEAFFSPTRNANPNVK